MTKLKLLIELEYDPVLMHEDSDEGRGWFVSDVLRNTSDDEGLLLHSNLIEDSIGKITSLQVIEPQNLAQFEGDK